jgi:hypothetical protein
MDWSLCKMKKGTPNEIFRPEFQELVNEKYNDDIRIYTDGLKKEEKGRLRGRFPSAINMKKDKIPIINNQRGTRSHQPS